MKEFVIKELKIIALCVIISAIGGVFYYTSQQEKLHYVSCFLGVLISIYGILVMIRLGAYLFKLAFDFE